MSGFFAFFNFPLTYEHFLFALWVVRKWRPQENRFNAVGNPSGFLDSNRDNRRVPTRFKRGMMIPEDFRPPKSMRFLNGR